MQFAVDSEGLSAWTSMIPVKIIHCKYLLVVHILVPPPQRVPLQETKSQA